MASVTRTNLSYSGSITIDSKLLEAVDIVPNEKVQVVNINNGIRVQTYCAAGEANSGIVCMNGAFARCAEVGDKIIIMSYAFVSPEEVVQYTPKIISVNEKNQIQQVPGSKK